MASVRNVTKGMLANTKIKTQEQWHAQELQHMSNGMCKNYNIEVMVGASNAIKTIRIDYAFQTSRNRG